MNYDLIPKSFFALLTVLTLGFFGTGYYISGQSLDIGRVFSSRKELAALVLQPLPSPSLSPSLTPPPPLPPPPLSNEYAPFELPPETTAAERSLVPMTNADVASSTKPAPGKIPDKASTTPAMDTAPFQRYLTVGTVGPDVKTLQILLNQQGYPIAKTGPGSKGRETQKYGPATAKAIGRLQCDRGLECSGTPETNGYGAVDDDTRAILNALFELSYGKTKPLKHK